MIHWNIECRDRGVKDMKQKIIYNHQPVDSYENLIGDMR